MRSARSLRWYARIIVLSFCVLTCQGALADPKKGGFFDDDFAKKGFFDPTPGPKTETKPEPKTETPAASATAVPTQAEITPAPTAVPTSQADLAHEIFERASGAIQGVRNSNADPQQQQRILNAVTGVRAAVNQSMGTAPKVELHDSQTKDLTVAVTLDAILKELSVAEGPEKPLISLVVRAEPRANYLRTLDRLFVQGAKRGAKLKTMFAVGWNKDLTYLPPHSPEELRQLQNNFNRQRMPPEMSKSVIHGIQELVPASRELLETLGMHLSDRHISLDELLKHYNITYSPAWVVETSAQTLIFEGGYDPAEFLDEKGFLLPNPPQESRPGVPFDNLRAQKDREVTIFEYREPPHVERPHAAMTREIKDCTRSRVRKLLTGPATMGVMDTLDIVLYSPDDPAQDAAAKKYPGVTFAYSSRLTQSDADLSDPLMPFIRTLPIRCLPTRIRYINEGSKQYSEYRQGEAAWGN